MREGLMILYGVICIFVSLSYGSLQVLNWLMSGVKGVVTEVYSFDLLAESGSWELKYTVLSILMILTGLLVEASTPYNA